jgi:hypothetical protein
LDYFNDTQLATETISHESKLKLIALGYENWLREQQSQGSYNAPISHYHPSTVKEFLIDYRVSEQKKWNKARFGSKNQVSEFRFRSQGYEADDGNTLAKYYILSAFESYSDQDIKNLQDKPLESFISRVYADKNRTFNDVNKIFNDVNKVDSHREGLLKKFLSKISHFFQTREINSGPLKEAPRASKDPQSLGRARSMPESVKHQSTDRPGAGSGKRKRSNPDQDPAQKYPRITTSKSDSYFEAYISGNRSKIAAAEDARFEIEIKFQEMKEAERKEGRRQNKKPKNRDNHNEHRACPLKEQVKYTTLSLVQMED